MKSERNQFCWSPSSFTAQIKQILLLIDFDSAKGFFEVTTYWREFYTLLIWMLFLYTKLSQSTAFVSHNPPLPSNFECVIHSSGLFIPSIQTKLLLVIKLGHRFYILRYTFSVEVKSVLHFNLTGADTSQPWTRLLLNSTSLLPRLLALAFFEVVSSALGVFYWYR